jgi:DNA invertase Pin-like site-specific DNA recombinase
VSKPKKRKRGAAPAFEKSTEQQGDENAAAAAVRGWTIAETYRDDGLSASRYATRARDEYERLLADLEAGKIDVLILWESSRGSRQVSEWIKMLEIIEEHGVRIYVTNQDQIYDPRNRRNDRYTLIDQANKAEKDSGDTSDRIRRSGTASAAAGKPWGRTPFGYERIYDNETRELIEQRPKPGEAAVVRHIFAELARGVSISAVTRQLNAGEVLDVGYVPPLQAPQWVPPLVRAIALRETYRGMRTHYGQITEGIWPPLVDDATFYAVKRILRDPKRKKTINPGKARHLLSLIAECGECGSPMAAYYGGPSRRRAATYQCRGRNGLSSGGCTSINQDDLDAFVTKATFERLHETWDAITSGEGSSDAEILAARAEIAALRARLDEHYDESAAGRLSARALARIEPQIEGEIAAAERRAETAATAPVLRWLLTGSRDELRNRWEAAPASTRREVIKELFSAIKVFKRTPGRGYGEPAESRTELWFRDDDA